MQEKVFFPKSVHVLGSSSPQSEPKSRDSQCEFWPIFRVTFFVLSLWGDRIVLGDLIKWPLGAIFDFNVLACPSSKFHSPNFGVIFQGLIFRLDFVFVRDFRSCVNFFNETQLKRIEESFIYPGIFEGSGGTMIVSVTSYEVCEKCRHGGSLKICKKWRRNLWVVS